MPPADYLAAGYYERWLWSTEQRLVRRGTLGERDVDGWVERLRRRARRCLGARTRRLRASAVDATGEAPPLPRAAGSALRGPATACASAGCDPAGHTRCPRYVRGVAGVVEAVRGVDAFPDIGPYEGPEEPVYAVAFDIRATCSAPRTRASGRSLLDLFESYLEPA